MSMMWVGIALTPAELAHLCKAANPFAALGGIPEDRCCELEKAWGAVHCLIAKDSEGGDYACFIESGGLEVPALDAGYGPARFFDRQGASSIRDVVSSLPRASVAKRWDAAKEQLKELYPFAGGGRDLSEEDRDYVLRRFEDLRQFLARMDGQNLGLLVFLC